jgi:hypothetical protein
MTRDEHLKRIAADFFRSETRRGYIANNVTCYSQFDAVDPNITEQEYIERFVEQNKDRDLNELEKTGTMIRPSNMPTAYERGL